jgi:hypothetical protein
MTEWKQAQDGLIDQLAFFTAHDRYIPKSPVLS